uniref:RTX-toxin n=1 Tax=Ganoderma boninense TaxID=34458 RepID=A0A5K1JUL3_9APHY
MNLFAHAANPNATNEDKGLDVSPPKDEDPDGTKLLQGPDLLERAAKVLKPLITMAKDNVDAWFAIYDVAIRRSALPGLRMFSSIAVSDALLTDAEKYLQAVQALNHAHALNADSPELHIRVVDLKRRSCFDIGLSLSEKPSEDTSSAASSAILKLLPDEVSMEVFNSQYLQRHSSRADAILAAAKVSRTLGAPREEVEASLFNALNADVELKLETALAIVAFLSEIQSPREEEFRTACRGKFELSTLFLTPADLVAARKAVVQKDPVAEAVEDKAEVIS